MSKELKGKIRKGMFWVIASNMLTIGSQVLSVAVLARMLSPEDFGLQSIGLILLDMTVIFTYPFINKSIILRKEINDDFLKSATMLSFLLSLLMAVIFYVSSGLIADFFNDPNATYVVNAICVIFLIKGLYQPYNSLFEKELRFKEISNINLAAFWAGYFIVPVLLAYLGYGFKALVIGLIVHEAVLLAYFLIKSHLKIGWLKKQYVSELLLDTRSLILQALGNRIATNGDMLIISRFLGTESLGYYSRAYKLMKMPTTFIGNVINNLSFASLAQVSEDDEKLRKAFIYSSFILALVSFPVFFTTLLFAEEIILILLGSKWLAVVPALQILSFGIFLRMAYKVPVTILKVKQKFAIIARTQLIYAFNIIAFSLLLLKYGVEGVALGTLIALIIQYVQMIYQVNKCIKIDLPVLIIIIFRPLISSAVYASGLWLINRGLTSMNISDILSFVISTGISFLIFGLVVMKFGKAIFGEPLEWWLKFFQRDGIKKPKIL